MGLSAGSGAEGETQASIATGEKAGPGVWSRSDVGLAVGACVGGKSVCCAGSGGGGGSVWACKDSSVVDRWGCCGSADDVPASCDSFLGSGAGGAETGSGGASSGNACRKLEGTKPLCPFKSP